MLNVSALLLFSSSSSSIFDQLRGCYPQGSARCARVVLFQQLRKVERNENRGSMYNARVAPVFAG